MRMLISVEHGHRRLTMSVPADVPVEALLPRLLDACGEDPTATWALIPHGGVPVAPGRSLRESGVWPGALLTLRMAGPGEGPRPRAGRTPWLPGLPARLLLPQRLGLALLASGGVASGAAWRESGPVARLERAIAGAARRQGVAIAVAAIRPGSGATTLATLLAMVLARALPEPPLAIDADLDERALSRHLAPADPASPETYAAVLGGRLRLAPPARPERGPYGIALLPAPAGPAEPPDPAACTALIARLRAAGRTLVIDCPAGFAGPWGQAAWAAADQFVLVSDGTPDDAAALVPVAARLAAGGAAVCAAANRTRRVRALAAAGLPPPLAAVAADPAAAAQLEAGVLTWEAAPEAWRRPVAHLAAALSTGWR